MFLSVVSLPFLLQVSKTPEPFLIEKVAPSLVYIQNNGTPDGLAALIDKKGYFVADRCLIASKHPYGETYDGKRVSLKVIFSDEPSQLVLLRAEPWPENHPAVQVASKNDLQTKTLHAVLVDGTVKGEWVASQRAGVSSSRRYIPLSEIRFETPDAKVGGALVFTSDGKLAGVLGATLEPVKPIMPKLALAKRPQGEREIGALAAPIDNRRAHGPAGMTVSYSLGIEVLDRVIEGFKSPSRKPQHPTIGMFFKDASGMGAVVEIVQKGRSADNAGIKVGDVILGLNGSPIPDAMSLAAGLFRQKVGSVITLDVKRGNKLQRFSVAVLPLESESADDKIFDVPLEKAAPIENIDRGAEKDVSDGVR